MYFYLYDEFLNEKKYKSALDKIENRLTDLEMKHKTSRLSILKNIKGMIEDEIRNGATTIVAVGDDQTVFRAINVLASYPDITLGIIPVGPHNNIAKILGIPSEEEACDVLSSRIIKKLDLGKINHHFFISEVVFQGNNLAINCDNEFTIRPDASAQVHVYNFNFRENSTPTNPQDGVLELFVRGKGQSLLPKLFTNQDQKKDMSLFSFRNADITTEGEPVAVHIDQNHTIKTPVHISILPQRLRVIVGKHRMFE